MASTVHMPKLGLTMTKGTIISWAKKEGDRVQRGERLAVIETEKVTAEIAAPADGILLKILSPARSSVVVGQAVAFIGQAGEALPQISPVAQSAPPSLPGAVQMSTPSQSAAVSTDRSFSATPKAKRLAKDKNLDLAQVNGTGPLGMISEDDVLRYLEQTKGMTKSGLRVKEARPLTGIRRTIAERMTSSLQTTAQVTIIHEVDASEISAARGQPRAGSKVTYTEILVKLLAKVLQEYPIMNSELEDDEIKILEEINIGVAVATQEGLMVPVIRNADAKTLEEIAVAVGELAEGARGNRLALEDVTGGTFTITNLGMTAVDTFTPILNPPQVAILGVGRISMKPVAGATGVEVRPRMNFSLTFDHRVVDGYTAGMFMARLSELVEKPELLREALSEAPRGS